MAPKLDSLDHLVLTVADIEATVAFYRDALGLEPAPFQPAEGPPRMALRFGAQKINLHAAAAPFEPKAAQPTVGSADLCFLTATPLADWQAHLAVLGIPIEAGPMPRSGATGPILSLYLRDPNGNLIEIATPA